jgi:DNA-binding CsgD family transcriptional regulator
MTKAQASEDHGLPSLSLVFGYIAVKELRLLEDRIRVLARLGYGNDEIAKICDTKPTVVRTLKSKVKRKSVEKSLRRIK